MNYFLNVEVEDFYCKALREAVAHDDPRPLVVHRHKNVLCACPKARRRGITLGMPVSEAKAILRDAAVVEWKEEPYREAQEAWLQICTEFSDVVEPEDQHIAYVDLSNHPDPSRIALLLAREIGNRLGYRLRLGMAATKWIARLACSLPQDPVWQEELRLFEPVLDPAGFVSDFPVSSLLPATAEDRRRLQFLGYRTIGDVTNLSLGTLRGQFGERGLRIHQAAWGGCFEPVLPIYPRDTIQARFVFESEVETTDALEHGLESLADGLAAKLHEKDLQGSQIKAWIDFECMPQRVLERTFIKPMQSRRSILVALKAIVCGSGDENFKPVAIRIQMPNLEKAKRRQADLYGSLAEKSLGVENSVSLVRQVFGDGAVKLAAQVSEPRRKKLMRVWKDATGWR